MDGSHLKFSLKEITQADDTLMRELIVRELWRLSVRESMNFFALIDHLADIQTKIKSELAKFNPSLPYPAQGVDLLSVQIEAPKSGKVGICAWSHRIEV